MVAARARELYDQQAKERQAATRKRGNQKPVPENLPEREHIDARDAAGKAVGVSGRTVDFATKVLAHGTPELVKAVDEGRMAVNTAVTDADWLLDWASQRRNGWTAPKS